MFGPLVTPGTVVNDNFKRGMHLRRNSKLQIFNTVLAGYVTGVYIEGPSITNAQNGELKLKNVVLAGCATNFGVAASDLWTVDEETNWFNTPNFNNTIFTSNTDLSIIDPFNLISKPNFSPVFAYKLNGWAYVIDGVTLTIEAGTIIRGDKANKAALIVERGGKLIANGTVSEPIIFTSNQAAGSRTYGDWGGVILCGKAKVNKVEPQIEGGPRSHYGGTDDTDNSGSLKYVRIEFPGIAFQPDKEINGLTFGGVGSGTTIDYIQVSYSGDDSYEWFGGFVNCKHMIAFRGWDDDFDTDYGYRGMVQFGVGLRDPAIADPGSGSNGFESDNDGNGSGDTPITQAIFSNISMFGPLVTPNTTVNDNYKRAMHLRRNSAINIFNTIFGGYLTGLYIEGPSITNAQDNMLKLQNDIIAGTTSNFGVAFSDLWDVAQEETWYMDPSRNNGVMASNDDLNITDPFNLSAPNFLPKAGSAVITGSYWGSQGIEDYNRNNFAGLNCYPNPFENNTTITVDLQQRSYVRVDIYNMAGYKVSNLVSREAEGLLQVDFNADGLPKGIYFAKVTSNGNSGIIKLIVR